MKCTTPSASRESVAVALIAFAAALATAAPSGAAAPSQKLGYDDARQLLARTGFGPTDAEVRDYSGLTREEAVAKLLRETRTTALSPPPASAIDTSPLRAPRPESATIDERRAFIQQQVREGLEIRGWWMGEMLTTPSPLTERMTLFWHNHFVSAQPKVRVSRLMYGQNVLLRENALGNFATLLHAVAKDPAMVIYLDSVQNRTGAPNENFAREVMELFTLGEGHYTEQDIKEAARAFTGWSLDRETGRFVFRPRLHDAGMKTVFGKTGDFDGDAVLDLLLARPETAEFVTAKLWREFVSPEPDPAEVRRIAARFRESNYEIKVALRELLLCDAFYRAESRGTLVKSPVEVVVGTLRSLGLKPEQPLPFAIAAAGMGQNLMSPPNVKGWPGGETWINTSTLLARKQFVDRVTRYDERGASAMVAMTGAANGNGEEMQSTAMPAPVVLPTSSKAEAEGDAARLQRFRRQMERGLSSVHFDSVRWMAQFPGSTGEERAKWGQRLLLAVEPQQAPDLSADSLSIVRAYVQDPAYQLK
jgi:uncharacterized protein (DUF1800 family)